LLSALAVFAQVRAHGSASDHGQDRQFILNAYASVRAAHFRHDAARFLANQNDTWIAVADGNVTRKTVAGERSEVQAYFDSVEFGDIVDLDPPHLEFSPDGNMAWFVGHVRVTATQRQADGTKTPLAFDAAWINVWEKKSGQWKIVADANTEKNNASR